MRKSQIFLIVLVSIAVFLLVYSPHYNYPFPRHVDEWHHISEAIKISQGEYTGGIIRFRVGFHFLLMVLSKIANLVLIYRFLPAIWAVFSALILFYVVYKKSSNQFFLALSAMIFFASIKSNVNITGLWFFTPLTFCIPFIFLYIFFFTEGIERQNEKLIILSFIIMVFLIPTHAISLIFSAPFLLIYCLFNIRHIRKVRKSLIALPLVAVIGLLFYRNIAGISWRVVATTLLHDLQFRRGWGVLELNNSPFELYSFAGYILAAAGLVLIFTNRENREKYLVYGLWPIWMLTIIVIYKKAGASFFSPYQRNLYYFALSLPLLSAVGFDYLFKLINRMSLIKRYPGGSQRLIAFIASALILVFTFNSYLSIPERIRLYEIINNDDYQTLLFLSKLPEKSVVLAKPGVSTAIYAISKHYPVGTYFFYGNRQDCERFFLLNNCASREYLLKKHKVKYVISDCEINCGWELIYDRKNYVYRVY